MGEFNFNGDDVGQCNVIKERIKRVKNVGAMRGMCVDSILVVQICCLILLYNFVPVLHHKSVFSICSTNSFYLSSYGWENAYKLVTYSLYIQHHTNS
jgi:hypothetical protein